MVDNSPQISLSGSGGHKAAGEPNWLEHASAAKRGKTKNALGVFGKLFAGLRGEIHTPQGKADTEALAASPELQGGRGKKAKGDTLLAALRKGVDVKKQSTEELVAPRGRRTDKGGKGASPEEAAFAPFGTQSGPPLLFGAERGLESGEIAPGAAPSAALDAPLPETPRNDRPDFRKTDKASGISGGKAEDAASGSLRFPHIFHDGKTGEGAAESREGENVKRTGSKRKEKIPNVEISDLRSHVSPESFAGFPADGGAFIPERELILELRPAGEKNAAAGWNGGEQALSGEDGQSFQSLLAERLSGDLSSDIVKQAAIVLRDGGEGTIRLSLKPETLGKVKIHLEMAENKISGLIFVESEEALRAFQQEIHTLEQAFRDSGFSEASLDTAFGPGSGDQKKDGGEKPFYSDRFAASSYDESSQWSEMESAAYNGGGLSSVNMLV